MQEVQYLDKELVKSYRNRGKENLDEDKDEADKDA
jgi:hypothetical protein